MSLFSRLFGTGSNTDSVARPQAADVLDFDAFGDRFVSIRARDFFGQFSWSPDGQYVLAWRDGTDAGNRGGYRTEGLGRFLLYRGNRLLVEGRAERPNDGHVANDGTFVINDWLFGGGLNGVFRAYRVTGDLIVERRFEANLYNNGIAADGVLAVCQTCNAPGPDGSILTVFDLGAGTEIASWMPDSGWASRYDFPADGETISLENQDGSVCLYSLYGEFLNRHAWTETQSRGGNLYILANLLKDTGSDLSAETAALILDGVEAALSAPNFDERQRAFALKIRGSCLETQNELEDALASYDEALALDPKIGLKRRAEQLRKHLG